MLENGLGRQHLLRLGSEGGVDVIAPSNVIGAFLHGSSVRPYGVEGSDLDLAVLVNDEAQPAAAGAAHQKLWKDGLKIADMSFYKRTVFATPRVDMEHFRAAQARVLFDHDGVVASLLAEVAALPPALAATRMRVHDFEVVSLAGKVSAAQARGKLAAQLVHAAGRLLCFAANAWPAPMKWMFEELELSGTPEPLVTALRGILDEPQPKALRMLRGMLDGFLLQRGATFVRDPVALLDWIYETEDGLAAIARRGLVVF